MGKEKNGAPLCEYRKKCGGCSLWNMDYKRQLSYKQAKVIKLLGNFCHVDEIIGMEYPYHYRNKVQAAFGRDSHGRIISGIYQSGTHRIVAVKNCLTEDGRADEIIAVITELIKSFKLTVYNEDTGEGLMRHVLVKRGFKSGEIMVVLVVGTNIFPKKRSFINALLKRCPDITTVVLNINDRHTNLVLGSKQEILFGDGRITEELLGRKFRISPKSFYQINPVQTAELYKKVAEFASLNSTQTVVDAYCGTGTIGITLADRAAQVIGVELNKDAVRDAKENAKLNSVKNAKFYCADAGEFMLSQAKAGETLDVVITDPPRVGCSRMFLSSLVSAEPKKVVYVSCNPSSQRRDLMFFVKNGYRVRKIQPVDMFPFTDHVETVVLMSRVEGK